MPATRSADVTVSARALRTSHSPRVAGGSWFLTQREEGTQVPPSEPFAPAGTQPLPSVLHQLSPVPFPDIPSGRWSVWETKFPLHVPSSLLGISPKPRSSPGQGGWQGSASQLLKLRCIHQLCCERGQGHGAAQQPAEPSFPRHRCWAGQPSSCLSHSAPGLAASRRELLAAEEEIFGEEKLSGWPQCS